MRIVDKTTFMKKFGSYVKNRRRALNLTQEEFAKAVDMARPSIANIERGRQSVNVYQAYKFSLVLANK